ncbi:hypothetical protein JTB14_024395 [Gonioctena quinquepunctata]|nr:hypothetical protein JTB14_024395 [Gonioctena quinquepunctata]
MKGNWFISVLVKVPKDPRPVSACLMMYYSLLCLQSNQLVKSDISFSVHCPTTSSVCCLALPRSEWIGKEGGDVRIHTGALYSRIECTTRLEMALLPLLGSSLCGVSEAASSGYKGISFRFLVCHR